MKGKSIVRANPLYIETEKIHIENKILKGEILPLWTGKLQVMNEKGKILCEIEVSPTKTIRISTKINEKKWILQALDRKNNIIGKVESDNSFEIETPEVKFPTIFLPLNKKILILALMLYQGNCRILRNYLL